MLKSMGQFRLQYSYQAQGALGSLVAMPSLLRRVIASQGQDVEILSIRDRVQSGMGDRFERGDPQLIDLREEIPREFHYSRFVVHPSGTKMYCDLRYQYYWSRMKQHVGDFVQWCLTCQQVKVVHQKPVRLL